MPVAQFNHGTRVVDAGSDPRSLAVADLSAIGAAVIAPDADNSVFPLDEPVAFYTHETEKVAALGDTGNAVDIVNAVKAQGIEAQIVMVRCAEGVDNDATMANLIGSAASQSGVHALDYAAGHVGVQPDLLIAPGYSATRISNAKNPVADALESAAKKLKAIAILDTGGPDKAASLAYRADFSSRYTYLLDPYVRVADGTDIVAKPGAPFAASLFVKRDKQKGGAYWSPSNQAASGILGTTRPISFFDGEVDHEANALNEAGIATFIPSRNVQGVGGAFSANGRVLWGNRTTSDDPNWAFVNVVRTAAVIEKTIISGFRWANDENMNAQHILAVQRSAQALLDEMKAVGAILGGQVYWDRDLNPNASLKAGSLRVEYDYEPTPPLEDLTFGARRNEDYFDELADDVRRQMSVSFSTQITATA